MRYLSDRYRIGSDRIGSDRGLQVLSADAFGAFEEAGAQMPAQTALLRSAPRRVCCGCGACPARWRAGAPRVLLTGGAAGRWLASLASSGRWHSQGRAGTAGQALAGTGGLLVAGLVNARAVDQRPARCTCAPGEWLHISNIL